jgi:F0F1-type ATP synthase beta subunit
MDSTDGLSRGYEVVGTGNPIQMPVGEMFTDVFNVIDAIDGLGNLPKQVKTECQFTVKHQDLRFSSTMKFYTVLI